MKNKVLFYYLVLLEIMGKYNTDETGEDWRIHNVLC